MTLIRSFFYRTRRFLSVKGSCCRCVNCGMSLVGGLDLIKCGGCGSFQPAPPTRSEPTCCPDYYRLLLRPRPPVFKIDLKELRKEYLKLQAAVHPDRVGGEIGQSWSSWINRANETLKDPLQRAIYLVNLYEKQQEQVDCDFRNSDEEIEEGHDISLVLEVREEMDSTDDPTVLSQIKRDNDERIESCCTELENILDIKIDNYDNKGKIDLPAAKRCINRLRYWMSIDRELKER